jgi:hypothetical protein
MRKIDRFSEDLLSYELEFLLGLRDFLSGSVIDTES